MDYDKWTLTRQIEKKMILFEKKILIIVCVPLYNNELGLCQRRKINELQEMKKVLEILGPTNFFI